MNRTHLVLPVALLATSALLGGRALTNALPLGSDNSEPAASVGQLTDATDDSASTELEAIERRLAALEAQRAQAAASSSGPSARSGSKHAAAPRADASTSRSGRRSGAPVVAPRAADGHGGGGRDHAEDDGTVEAHDVGDDHGGDRVGGSDDGASDDHGRHGGDDGSRGGDDHGSDDD
ncbi:MAG: hypothetical protein JWM86_1338 [Thermoleophilia bacterium]|nr:hypothetical protein [Thermoleophilia bacterium]